MKQQTRHPTREHLDALFGEWETEVTYPYLPGVLIHGRATLDWPDGTSTT